MARIKLMGNGKYCLERRVRAGYKQPNKTSVWRDWFLVKHSYNVHNDRGYFSIGDTSIITPKELIGKRVRLVVEVMEEKNENIKNENRKIKTAKWIAGGRIEYGSPS